MAAAGLVVSLPLQAFTLMWTHSIEKIRWEEDYRIVDATLYLATARIRGSGAGMEPPDGAILRNGVWHYQPAQNRFPSLTLARSPYVADYFLCWETSCSPMANLIGSVEKAPVVELQACPSDPVAR